AGKEKRKTPPLTFSVSRFLCCMRRLWGKSGGQGPGMIGRLGLELKEVNQPTSLPYPDGFLGTRGPEPGIEFFRKGCREQVGGTPALPVFGRTEADVRSRLGLDCRKGYQSALVVGILLLVLFHRSYWTSLCFC